MPEGGGAVPSAAGPTGDLADRALSGDVRGIGPRGPLRTVLVLFTAIAAAYAGVLLLLVWQQDLMVFPGAGRGDRGLPPLPGLQAASLARSEGGAFRICHARPEGPASGIAVVFVGNGEDLHSGAMTAHALSAYGLEAIAVEHPGYGSSDGPPSVGALMEAALRAGEFARRRADELGVPLCAVGTSLGSFCAVEVARHGLCDRLLLRAPPSTLAAAAQARFPWAPVSFLLRHRFDSLTKAHEVRCPALVLHGDQDRVVPLELGRALVEAFAGKGELVVAKGYGHNNIPLERDGAFGPRILAFLEGR